MPSSVAGKIKEIKVKAGDKVKVGQAILSVEDGGAAPQRPAPRGRAGGSEPPPEAKPSLPQLQRRPKNRRSATLFRVANSDRDKVVDFARGARRPPISRRRTSPSAPAAPSVRRMARELGVDIDEVAGSGDDGRISIEDVKAHAKRLITAAAAPPARRVSSARRRRAAARLQQMGRRSNASRCAASVARPPNISARRGHRFRSSRSTTRPTSPASRRSASVTRSRRGDGAPPLTVTALAIKIVAAALKVFPQFNVSIDMAAEEIIVKKYIHIGVAVDTDRGLLVPVIRDADTKSLLQISAEVSRTGREGTQPQADARRDAGRDASASRISAASAAPPSRRSSTRQRSPSSASRAAAWNRSSRTASSSRG